MLPHLSFFFTYLTYLRPYLFFSFENRHALAPPTAAAHIETPLESKEPPATRNETQSYTHIHKPPQTIQRRSITAVVVVYSRHQVRRYGQWTATTTAACRSLRALMSRNTLISPTRTVLRRVSNVSAVPSVLRRCWLGGRKDVRPVKTEWWGAGVVVCVERGADLHMNTLDVDPPRVELPSAAGGGGHIVSPAAGRYLVWKAETLNFNG